ncbi:MAG: outer membrane protein transport protein [Labilithrix sp.]|nr:outer membrane protein transport protein [Labilithrix sp.]MCW5834901.1 outer membrane protein transport protein [Labilithrix sp.]
MIASLAAVGALATPREAEASGYLTARFGADHGTPAQPNTFAVYFNPAALGGTTGTTITGDVSVLLRFVKYNRTADALSPSNDSSLADQSYIDANTGTASLTNLLALPFVGVNTDFGTKNLRAGYAAYVPFGGLATWDRIRGVPGSPGSTDGVQRWHNISGQILAVYNTFAIAYKIAPAKLSIGASVSPVIHNVATARARNADGSDDTVSNGSLIEGRSFINATGINLAASAGVYYEPTDTLRFGLSYLSQPGFGETRMSGVLRTQLGAGQESKADIDFLQEYPDIIRFGGAWRATERLELRGDVEFVRWNVFKRQCVVEKGAKCAVADDGRRLTEDPDGQRVQLNVPRNWDNAVGVRVGPGYWINEKLEAFGSLGMTTPAVPKETIDASTIDALRLYLTFGARYEINKHWALAGSYNHIYFFNVDTKGANDQNITAHPASSPGGGDYNVSRSPSADGRYRSQIGFLNVNVAYTF